MSATPLPPIHRWDSVAQPRALIHIVHGMSEHGGRYARLAAALNRAGYVAWAHEHRAAYRAAVLSGSNGPGAALEAVGRLVAFVQRLALGGRARGMWLRRLVIGGYNRQFAPIRTTADWLSRDAAEVDRFIADELCGTPLSAQSWVDFLASKAMLGTHEHLRRIPRELPVLLISGTRDPVGENGRGVRRLLATYQAAGLTRVTMKLYDDARHELVNEINREVVTADLITWLDEVTASRT